MTYAPVVKATLNRHEHLKCALESLKKDAWSKYTDVYISIAYPPSDKYRSDYEKVSD